MVNISLSDSFWRKNTLQPWLLFFSPCTHTADPQTNQQQIFTHKRYLTNLFSVIWSRKHTKDENINLEHDWSFVNKSVFWLLCRWLFSPRKQSLTRIMTSVWVCTSAPVWSLCTGWALSPTPVSGFACQTHHKTPWFPPALLFNCSSELLTSSGMSCSLLRHPRWGAEDCREKEKI